MSYDQTLDAQFRDLAINLVKHDTSFSGLPAYIEVSLCKAPKNKAAIVLDLGNYIYRRFGIAYQMCPEFRGRGKSTTIRWFLSWDNLRPILPNIKQALDCTIPGDHLPQAFNSLIIQNTARGVYAPRANERI